MKEEDFLSIKEFAVLLKLHPNTIRRHIKKGRIVAFRIDPRYKGTYRIPRTEINKMCFDQLEHVIQVLMDKRDKEKNGN